MGAYICDQYHFQETAEDVSIRACSSSSEGVKSDLWSCQWQISALLIITTLSTESMSLLAVQRVKPTSSKWQCQYGDH